MANGEDKANPVLLSSKYQIWKDVKKYGIFFKKISQKEHTIQCRSKRVDSLLFLYSVFWTSTEPLIGQIVLGIFRQMDVFQGRSFHLWKNKGGNCFLLSFWNIKKGILFSPSFFLVPFNDLDDYKKIYLLKGVEGPSNWGPQLGVERRICWRVWKTNHLLINSAKCNCSR